MGITGLLPFLKPASHHTNIRNYSGCTVAVDSYCWLHKGAFSCADKLAKGEDTDRYVVYCMKMINSLLSAGVRPIMVFDGQNLPSKEVTDRKRHEERQNRKRIAKNYLIDGKLKEARESFQRCTEVTSEMAQNLIKACRKIGVDCVVAPYEADAQLAYLNKIGIAQIIITEDSDLVLFGCEKIMYKMDINGNGIMVEKSRINDCLGSEAGNFTFDKFRYMCIMSGCDYLPSLTGIGLKKALKFFSKATNPNLSVILTKIPIYLNMPSVIVTKEYIQSFIQANNTFLYQLVFDPLKRKIVPLNPYEDDVDPAELVYAGPHISNELALQIALGNINVDTKKKIDDYDPILCKKVVSKSVSWACKSQLSNKSIWDPDYVVQAPKSILEPTKSSQHVNVSTPNNSTNKKRPFESSSDSFAGTTNDQLLAMYSSEDRTPKLSRTLSALSAGECEKMVNTPNALPTVKCSSYFGKPSISTSAEIPPLQNEHLDTNKSSTNDDSDKTLNTTSSFDRNVSSLFHANKSSSQPNNHSKSASSPGNFAAKYRDLFQRYGYNVHERLTLSPLNHTPFKSVLVKSDERSDTRLMDNSLESRIESSSSQSITSQDDSVVLDSDAGSLNSSCDKSLVGCLEEQCDKKISITSLKCDNRADLMSLSTKGSKPCKAPGLSRRHSVMLPVQQDGSKRQLSLKESLAKYQFTKNRKLFSSTVKTPP